MLLWLHIHPHYNAYKCFKKRMKVKKIHHPYHRVRNDDRAGLQRQPDCYKANYFNKISTEPLFPFKQNNLLSPWGHDMFTPKHWNFAFLLYLYFVWWNHLSKNEGKNVIICSEIIFGSNMTNGFWLMTHTVVWVFWVLSSMYGSITKVAFSCAKQEMGEKYQIWPQWPGERVRLWSPNVTRSLMVGEVVPPMCCTCWTMPPSVWRPGTRPNHKTVAKTHDSRCQTVRKHKPQSYSEFWGLRTKIWNRIRYNRVTQTWIFLEWSQRAWAKHYIARMAILLRLCRRLHSIFQRKRRKKLAVN